MFILTLPKMNLICFVIFSCKGKFSNQNCYIKVIIDNRKIIIRTHKFKLKILDGKKLQVKKEEFIISNMSKKNRLFDKEEKFNNLTFLFSLKENKSRERAWMR